MLEANSPGHRPPQQAATGQFPHPAMTGQKQLSSFINGGQNATVNAADTESIHRVGLIPVSIASRAIIRIVLPFVLSALPNTTFAGGDGLITKQSRYSVTDTIARFEKALKEDGFTVFPKIEHAAAAKEFDLNMLPRTVIMFGDPQIGTPVMMKTPLMAIDFPLKALVWQDEQGKVWLSYNSADYLFNTLYVRHGLTPSPTATSAFGYALSRLSYATK